MRRVTMVLGVVVLIAASLASVLVTARPAAGERGGYAHCGRTSCPSEAYRDEPAEEFSSPPSRDKKKQTDCYLHRLDIPPGTEVYDQAGALLGVADGTGAWFYKVCNGSSEGALLSANPLVFLPDPNPEALRQQALRELTFPTPEIVTSPPADKVQLVNMRTWLSVGGSWRTLSSTAEVPGVSVTVTAEPARVLWDMGNGDKVVCEGPGSTYDTSRGENDQPGACFYRWRRSSAAEPDGSYLVTATLQWNVSWTVTGAPGGGALPEMEQSATRAVQVGEAQARSGAG
jgi:hypothetical protein